jgi:hypothetical protein
MTAAPCAYRTRDPGVISAWRAAFAARDAYIRCTTRILQDAGLGEFLPVYRLGGPWGAGLFGGLSVGDGPPPAGWRVEDGLGYAIPDRRRKAARQVSDAIEAVPCPPSPASALRGMPAWILARGRFITAGAFLTLDGTVLYVMWAADPEAAGETVDAAIWERIPMSSYYQAAEERDTAGDTQAVSGDSDLPSVT